MSLFPSPCTCRARTIRNLTMRHSVHSLCLRQVTSRRPRLPTKGPSIRLLWSLCVTHTCRRHRARTMTPDQHDPRDSRYGHAIHVDHDHFRKSNFPRIADQRAFLFADGPWTECLWRGAAARVIVPKSEERRTMEAGWKVEGGWGGRVSHGMLGIETEKGEDPSTEIGSPEMGMGGKETLTARSSCWICPCPLCGISCRRPDCIPRMARLRNRPVMRCVRVRCLRMFCSTDPPA